MTGTSTPQVRPAGPVQEKARCQYCGAPLNPAVYFCLQCAMPYKQIAAVLPPAAAPWLGKDTLIRLKAPHVWPLFWTYFAVVLGVAIVCHLAFGPNEYAFTWVATGLAMLITTCIFAGMHWASLAVQFKRLGFLHWAPWASLAMLTPLLAINYGYHGWASDLLRRHEGQAPETLPVQQLGHAGAILLICVFPAVLEEIAFRGLLQHWLQAALRPLLAIALASALFTVLHFSIVSSPYLFLVGMLLGWTKYKAGSLYPGMVIHFLHNLAVIEIFPGAG